MILHRVCLYGFLVLGASGSASTTLRFLNYSTISNIQWIFNVFYLPVRSWLVVSCCSRLVVVGLPGESSLPEVLVVE